MVPFQEMNIYLDISGTLVHGNGGLAFGADDFLQFIAGHWPGSTYWLSTYTWRGKDRAYEVISPLVQPTTRQAIRQFQPANWIDLKTDGIDFTTPFLWFDDNLFPDERLILKHNDALACHRLVNLRTDPNQLLDELEYLKSLV